MSTKLPLDNNYDLEQQFILRMTDLTAAKNLAAEIEAGVAFKENFTIEFKPDMRHTIVRYNGQVYQGQIMDLPCIMESLKTTDKKNFYKTADICQMMVCTQGDECGPLRGTAAYLDNRAGSRNKPFDLNRDNREFQFLHGITPPLKNVLRRRFRKSRRKCFVDMPKIEKEVKQLLRADLQSVNVKWEVIWTDPPAPVKTSNNSDNLSTKPKLSSSTSSGLEQVEQCEHVTADDEIEDEDEYTNRAYASIDHRDVFGEISSSSGGSSSSSTTSSIASSSDSSTTPSDVDEDENDRTHHHHHHHHRHTANERERNSHRNKNSSTSEQKSDTKETNRIKSTTPLIKNKSLKYSNSNHPNNNNRVSDNNNSNNNNNDDGNNNIVIIKDQLAAELLLSDSDNDNTNDDDDNNNNNNNSNNQINKAHKFHSPYEQCELDSTHNDNFDPDQDCDDEQTSVAVELMTNVAKYHHDHRINMIHQTNLDDDNDLNVNRDEDEIVDDNDDDDDDELIHRGGELLDDDDDDDAFLNFTNIDDATDVFKNIFDTNDDENDENIL